MGPSRNGEYLEIKNKILTTVHGAGHSELICLYDWSPEVRFLPMGHKAHLCCRRVEVFGNKCCKNRHYILSAKQPRFISHISRYRWSTEIEMSAAWGEFRKVTDAYAEDLNLLDVWNQGGKVAIHGNFMLLCQSSALKYFSMLISNRYTSWGLRPESLIDWLVNQRCQSSSSASSFQRPLCSLDPMNRLFYNVSEETLETLLASAQCE